MAESSNIAAPIQTERPKSPPVPAILSAAARAGVARGVIIVPFIPPGESFDS